MELQKALDNLIIFGEIIKLSTPTYNTIENLEFIERRGDIDEKDN